MSELHRITVDPEQCGGRPCIRSLRIRVKDVLDLLASGASRNEILEDYPYLEDADISAVLEYAARQSDHPVLHVALCISSSTHNCRQRLRATLRPEDTKAEHVADIGLGGAKDQAIWEYAARVGAVIVSKDENFAQRTFFGKGGPLVVWIRLPNSPKRELLLWFEPLLPSTDHRGLGTG